MNNRGMRKKINIVLPGVCLEMLGSFTKFNLHSVVSQCQVAYWILPVYSIFFVCEFGCLKKVLLLIRNRVKPRGV